MVVIESGVTVVVDTGVCASMPRGFYGRICNQPGCGLSAQTVSGNIIDGNYTRSMRVIIYNDTIRQRIISAGDEIAVMIVQQYFVPSRTGCRRLDFGTEIFYYSPLMTFSDKGTCWCSFIVLVSSVLYLLHLLANLHMLS